VNKRLIVTGVAAFLAGVIVGGYLFNKSVPRSFLAVSECANACYRPSDLAGLLASAGIQYAPGLIPGIVRESDRCIAIKHPLPDALHHFVIFPKKDIKSIGEITPEDQAYVMDCIGMIRALALQYRLDRYDVLTNGPALQDVRYLHFHMRSWQDKR